MISTHHPKTTTRTLRVTRAGALSLFAVLAIVAASSSASAQLAGATSETEPAPRPAKSAARARSTSLNAAPGAARSSTAPATALVLAQEQQPMYGPTAAPPQAVTSVNVVSTSAPAPDRLTCVPDCRSGFVCREGECVSACNPQCGEGETCNARRECVAKTEAQSTESHPYDAVRFGVGGQIGVGSAADGTGTGYGGHIMVSLPLGGHFYSREDLIATYFKTSTSDDQVVGPTISPYGQTTIDQTYLLIALRATAGYQFGSFVSARAGALLGSHTLTAVHGYCGTGPQAQTFNSFAAGGTGALAFAMKHFDLSVVADVYSADTQAICGVVPGPFGLTGPATLTAHKEAAAQFLAQGTVLF